MLDSPFLESLISMVFVFGILSALASLIQEIQTQYMEIRPHFLVKGIRRMLSDDTVNSKPPTFWSEVWDFFGKGLKILSFPAAFPIIKKLTPSLSLPDKGNLKQKTKEEEEIHASRNLEKDYLLVDEFFNSSLIKYMGARDSKKPSYISKSLFTTALIDICNLKKYPSSEVDLLTIEFGPKLPKSVKSVLEAFLREAYRSTCHEKDKDCREAAMDQKFRELISNWYEDTMHRATGWFKRDATKWLFWWGLAIALALNADTFRLFKHFMSDSNARQIVKSQALQFNGQSSEDKANLLPNSDPTLNSVDSLQARLARHWNGEIKVMESSHVFGWRFPQSVKVPLSNSEAMRMGKRPAWRNAIDDFLESLPSKLYRILLAMPGLLATALAISFGAPFWFDILSSMVKIGGTNASIRLSGVKPADKKT
jgi:hypothetical protein